MARRLHVLKMPTYGVSMKNKDLLKKIAKMESINDQLAAELNYLEHLARALGFAEGLKTLKAAALEMLESEHKRQVKTEEGDSKIES